MNQDQAKEEMQQVIGWQGPNCNRSVSSECIVLQAHQCVSPTRRLTWNTISRVFTGFHYIGMMDWIIGHVIELSPQVPSLPKRSADSTWFKSPTPNHLVGLSGKSSLRNPPWITKKIPLLRKLMVFKGSLLGTRDKGQPNYLVCNKTLSLYFY